MRNLGVYKNSGIVSTQNMLFYLNYGAGLSPRHYNSDNVDVIFRPCGWKTASVSATETDKSDKLTLFSVHRDGK